MISQITKDLMEKTGLNFDEFGKIRVIDSQLTTNSEDLKNLCSEFTEGLCLYIDFIEVKDFKVSAVEYIELFQKLSKAIEKTKSKVKEKY